MGLRTSYVDDIHLLKLKERSRDKEIYNKYKTGAMVSELSNAYNLSPRCVQFILRNQKLLEEWYK